jgi:hypothetical protein
VIGGGRDYGGGGERNEEVEGRGGGWDGRAPDDAMMLRELAQLHDTHPCYAAGEFPRISLYCLPCQ